MGDPTSKICTGCGVDKPLDQYGTHPLGKYGLRPNCLPCRRAENRAWARANPDKIRANKARNYKPRPEYDREWGRRPEVRVRKSERRKALYAKLRARTPEDLEGDLARLRPDGVKACRKCRVRLPIAQFARAVNRPDGLFDSCRDCRRHSGIEITGDILALWECEGMTPTVCTYCGCNLRFRGANPSATVMTVDHIVPTASGGSDEPSNLAPACGPCNSSKGAKDLATWLTI